MIKYALCSPIDLTLLSIEKIPKHINWFFHIYFVHCVQCAVCMHHVPYIIIYASSYKKWIEYRMHLDEIQKWDMLCWLCSCDTRYLFHSKLIELWRTTKPNQTNITRLRVMIGSFRWTFFIFRFWYTIRNMFINGICSIECLSRLFSRHKNENIFSFIFLFFLCFIQSTVVGLFVISLVHWIRSQINHILIGSNRVHTWHHPNVNELCAHYMDNTKQTVKLHRPTWIFICRDGIIIII